MSEDVELVRALAREWGLVLSDDDAAAVAEQLRTTHASLAEAAARAGDDLDEPATAFDPAP